jgi:hypothetical protein
MKGVVAIKYLPTTLLAVRRTFVVWPGLRNIVSVLKGLRYDASASTTVSLWSAILKNSSSFKAAFIIRSR